MRAALDNLDLALKAMNPGSVEAFQARIAARDEVIDVRRCRYPDHLSVVCVADLPSYDR